MSQPANVSQILSKYSPCDVSDGMAKHGLDGSLPNLLQYSGPAATVAGPAYTVEFALFDDPRPEVQYIDSVQKGSVLCIGLDKRLQVSHAPYTLVNNALYGGLMSTRARYLGAVGTVVFGRIRDVKEHRELEYPVFAYGTGTAAPRPAVKPVALNKPLEVYVDGFPSGAYATISPGDTIIADENGVVRLPASLPQSTVDQILDYIPRRVRADELVAQDILAGVGAISAQKDRRKGL
ncbi:unnamed protein product [Kuraishia capsulata CBS 1993]|uniref:Uncharacterized protein n=1 Tax=Kuraishia capsulata CBS 1993 TaxID=1382522 RepID=W6MPJ9_9ASCO|nr:uncharacterized protein KUCA_T00004240001 [Kuraishia capsulata CBS 1993]CDK28258.1 unnamed protein product [Kuraishia capsulata CBS 1993]